MALANQTARATEEIAAQIRAIQDATQNSVQSIQGITTTIDKVNETATAISSAVEEQVLESSDDLSKNSEALRQQVDSFLREVRAA